MNNIVQDPRRQQLDQLDQSLETQIKEQEIKNLKAQLSDANQEIERQREINKTIFHNVQKGTRDGMQQTVDEPETNLAIAEADRDEWKQKADERWVGSAKDGERITALAADARAMAIAIRNWSVSDDESMNVVDNALLEVLETIGTKYLPQ